MTDLQKSLSKCRVEGNTLFLPPIKDGLLSNYNEVKTALIKAGAKYVKNTFVFPDDAQPYIDRLMGGEKVNIKKEFQFFETPPALADELVELADIKPHKTILEPEAGQGAIIEAIKRKHGNVLVDYCELMDLNVKIIEKKIDDKKINAQFVGNDFLQFTAKGHKWDYIIANPPFQKNQDIEHIYKMYDCLQSGGRMVSIASKHWQVSSGKKETEFSNWLKSVKATVKKVDAGAFKESGTNIETVIIIIDK